MQEIEEAIALVESGNVAKALNRLEHAEQTADDEERYQIAGLYYEWGHVDQAKKIVRKLRDRYPAENELAFFHAELLIDTGDEERAVEILTSIEGEEQDELRAMLLLADIYMSQGLDEVAEQKLLEAKRMAPDEAVVAYALGEFYTMLGDYKKSVPHYEQVLADGGLPGENVALRLAEAFSGSGEFEKALPYYQQAMNDPFESEGLFNYGFTAFQAGEYGQAVQVLTDLKERDPDFGKLYIYLVKSYRAEGAIPEALKTAEEGLAVNEFDDNLAYEAGDLALSDGRVEEAEQYLKKALEINSLHHGTLKSLAGLYSQQERYDEIITLLGAVEDNEEQDPVFAWYLATAKREQERYDEALRHYEHAYRALKEDPAFLEEYGDFLIEEGRREEAVTMFKQALAVDPSLVHLDDKMRHFEED
ncbi:MAG TPA: tetratricopeptide repeat protein [Bacillales bacterium]|nr:tetratricopeptide repeat protein [Bacillales bacterium]